MPEAQIISLDEFRRRSQRGDPCTVTFYSAYYLDDLEMEHHLALQTHLPDGNWKALLDRIHDDGGIAATDSRGDTWFLPWPCAALRITPSEPSGAT